MKQGNHSDSHGHQPQGHIGEGKDRHLHNPVEDRLTPLEPLNLSKVRSIDDLVRAMAKTAFTGRQLGEAADVLEVLNAITVEHGAALATIVDIARVKRDERGGFDLRLWLDGVDPQP